MTTRLECLVMACALSCPSCSVVVDFDGYRAAELATGNQDAGDSGAGGDLGAGEDSGAGGPDLPMPVVPQVIVTPVPPVAPVVAQFKSYRFERGPASFSVDAASGLLGSATGAVAISAGSFATNSGGGVVLEPLGGFTYVPPGSAGTFWGDDYFEYELAGSPPSRARVRLTVQPDALRLNELSLNPSAGFGIAGAAELDLVGTDETNKISGRHPSFAPAGDVNGDGLEDFVLGALGPSANSGLAFGQGRGAYVVFGKADGTEVSLADLGGERPRGFAILDDANPDNNDSLGYSVAGAGDVNGDGLDDIVIGSHTFDAECFPGLATCNAWGAAYVVFGKTDAAPVQCASFREGSGGGFAILAPTRGSYLAVGYAVAGAGDVNGDGLSDVLVDVPILLTDLNPVNNTLGGVAAAHVIFGTESVAPVHIENVSAGQGGFMIVGGDLDTALGNHLAGVGDVNGDGLADVAVSSEAYPGERLRGRVAVVFGKRDTAHVFVNELEASSARGFLIEGADDREQAGAPAYAGDFNGDGLDDILIGVPFASAAQEPPLPSGAGPAASEGVVSDPTLDAGSAADAGPSPDAGPCASSICLQPAAPANEGSVYVVFGSRQPSNVSLRAIEDGETSGLAFGSDVPGDFLGFSVSSGDLNGDGVSDVVASATPKAIHNEAYIIFGHSGPSVIALSGDGGPEDTGGLTLICEGPERAAGMVVSGSDVNGDGIDDLLVSSELYPNAPLLAGGAYVLFGWDTSGALAGQDGVLLGTWKDDVLELPGTSLVRARGGHGTDTLRAGRATPRLDLTPAGRYESLEVIDVRGGGPQEVVLDDSAIRRLPENQPGFTFQLVRRLTVLGDAEDALRFDRADYSLLGPNRDRDVYGRNGAYYGLEVSRAMQR